MILVPSPITFFTCARAAKERAAAENRARSGRTKGERTLEDAEAARRDSELDQAKIEDRDPA